MTTFAPGRIPITLVVLQTMSVYTFLMVPNALRQADASLRGAAHHGHGKRSDMHNNQTPRSSSSSETANVEACVYVTCEVELGICVGNDRCVDAFKCVLSSYSVGECGGGLCADYCSTQYIGDDYDAWLSFDSLISCIAECNSSSTTTQEMRSSMSLIHTGARTTTDAATLDIQPLSLFVEMGSTAWSPSSLTCRVGDTVTWKWSGIDAVYETTAANSAQAKIGGYSSGNPSIGGEFSLRLTLPGTYYLRSASLGFVTIVVVVDVDVGTDSSVSTLASSVITTSQDSTTIPKSIPSTTSMDSGEGAVVVACAIDNCWAQLSACSDNSRCALALDCVISNYTTGNCHNDTCVAECNAQNIGNDLKARLLFTAFIKCTIDCRENPQTTTTKFPQTSKSSESVSSSTYTSITETAESSASVRPVSSSTYTSVTAESSAASVSSSTYTSDTETAESSASVNSSSSSSISETATDYSTTAAAPVCNDDYVPRIKPVLCGAGDAKILALSVYNIDPSYEGDVKVTCAFWAVVRASWSCRWHGCKSKGKYNTSSNFVRCTIPEGVEAYDELRITVQMYHEKNVEGAASNACFSHFGLQPSRWAAHQSAHWRRTCVCPAGVALFDCSSTLCERTSCPGAPAAKCVVDHCGGCRPLYYFEAGVDTTSYVVTGYYTTIGGNTDEDPGAAQQFVSCQQRDDCATACHGVLNACRRSAACNIALATFSNMPRRQQAHCDDSCITDLAPADDAEATTFSSAVTCLIRCIARQYGDGYAHAAICALPVKPGPCRALVPRYFYNSKSEQCESFTYGGCKGNSNNFETLDACQAQCRCDQLG